jgi:CDP-4-dehydro-6-deoxyglucose reductase, E3
MAATEFLCTVKSFKMLTPTVFEATFEAVKTQSEHPDFAFEAGQFVSVVIPGAGPKGRDLRRAYSIASEPLQRPIELCVKLVEGGPGTNYLYKLRPGDVFKGFAPYGDFVYEPKAGRSACFIATGTGIAPFRSMVLSKAYQDAPPVAAWCLMGVRGEEELCYTDELSQLRGLHWVTAVTGASDKYKGFRGRVTDWLRAQGDDFPWKQTDYYLCGNGAMITEVQALLAEKGVEKDAIHKEKYY